MTSGLAWKLNRLRCMTPAEIGHRVARAAAMRVERMGFFDPAVPAPDLVRRAVPWVHADARLDPAPYVESAERIAAGRLDVFALADCDLGRPPHWNRCPKTGVEAPLAFGKQLDYRDPALVGDIKYLWEPNRHLQLVTLAQAYALTGDARHAEALRDQLESWFAACPYRLGPNWSSSLEAGLRLVNWALAWQLLGGVDAEIFRGPAGEAFRARWLASVYQHAEFVCGHLSLHSSANNHLIGELAGVFTAALAWPHWDRARRWMDVARPMLEREVLLQNAPDGVNREQATSYQQFELDLLLLPMLAACANGVPLSEAYRERIDAMLEYVASVMDAGGHVPMIGDADDGYVVRLDPRAGFCRYRSLLATGALLFGRGDFKAKAGALDDKTRWLLGAAAEEGYDAIDTSAALFPVRRAFPEGGYYILGCDFETPRELRLVADAGALGYREIAAHGHADALAFTLSLGGEEFLVDPGTFAYHTEDDWRAYFRGTAAHNTVRIDGCDQSQPGGNFMWLRKARAACSRWHVTEVEEVFEGAHDGYRALADPVTHRRRITLGKAARRLTIEDTLEMAGEHTVEIFFHCHEEAAVREVPGGFVVARGERRIHLVLPEGGQVRCLRGSLAPISGWVSRRFDHKQPAPTLVWTARVGGDRTLRTTLQC